MNTVKVLILVLKIASALLDFIERRRLLKQGEVNALTNLMGELNARLKKAADARDLVDDNPDIVSNDPNNRDRSDD